MTGLPFFQSQKFRVELDYGHFLYNDIHHDQNVPGREDSNRLKQHVLRGSRVLFSRIRVHVLGNAGDREQNVRRNRRVFHIQH